MPAYFLGPELVEAVRIGYQITRIWETMAWPVGRDLFTPFITKSYARKCAAKKDTPIYCVEKQLMNDLTGKFFQKVETSSFMILMDPSALQQEKVFHMTGGYSEFITNRLVRNSLYSRFFRN